MDMVALELIRNLQQIDHENEYFIFVAPDEDRNCLSETDNFKIIELDGGSYPNWEQRALPKAVKKYNCEILHCTSNTAPLSCPSKLVVTLHDIIYMEKHPLLAKGFNWYQRLGNTYRRYVVPRIVKSCDKLITVSKFEQKRICKVFNLPDAKVQAIYNGVSEHFKVINDQDYLHMIRTKYNLPEKFNFFLGNTDPKKNTPNVLKAYSMFLKESDEKTPLVMPDYDLNALQNILNQIEDPGLMDYIKLTGYIDNAELPGIYNLCDIFLYPSKRESFGIPILEGMRCGVPVITSTSSSMPEISGEAAYLVDPLNPEEIKDAIFKIKENKDLRADLIQRGLARSAEFTWMHMAKEVLKLYKAL